MDFVTSGSKNGSSLPVLRGTLPRLIFSLAVLVDWPYTVRAALLWLRLCDQAWLQGPGWRSSWIL